MTTLTNHGVQVSTVRQWTYALSPNAAGAGFNFVQASWPGTSAPITWNIVKNFTTTPVFAQFNTTTHNYPNSNFGISNQLRAQNGRIFFPCFGNNVVYYDPTTEDIHELPTIIETPPVNPNASTILFSGSFDVGGTLYLGTQESEFRPAMIVSVNPTTLAQTILGYVGTSAAYTTYAFRIAPDTVTASKYIYVAFGQNPWQLWALNITSGVTTKLYEVPSTGNIFFEDIPNKGWVATIDTALGQPSNVRTQWWCLDGAIYAYTVGVNPPVAARNVTPAVAPVAGAPEVDATAGTGIVRWRNGSSGPYTTVNYPVFDATPQQIESLVNWSGGVIGNVAGYQGFFKFEQPGTSTWFGAYQVISRGPRLTIDGITYGAGYPNGVFIGYDPAAPWDASSPNSPLANPLIEGYYGLNGTQYAGIKYSDFMGWAPGVGAQGTMYVCGSRERNGVGSGIGGWNKATGGFFGTYAEAGMDTVVPSGVCVLNSIGRVAMVGVSIAPLGADATLFVFDTALSLVFSGTPIVGATDLGQIWETATSGVITGIRQHGSVLNIWQYNVVTHTLISNVDTSIVGDLQPTQYRRPGTNKVYLVVGTNMVRVDVDALTVFVVADVSACLPADPISLAGDGVTMFVAGGTVSGISGAELYSFRFDDTMTADPFTGTGHFNDATLSNAGNITLVADAFAGAGTFTFADFVFFQGDSGLNRIGVTTYVMQNGDGSPVLFGQPVYSSGDGSFSLAAGDGLATSRVIGVTGRRIESVEFGPVVGSGPVSGAPEWWDAVCGTMGGLLPGTTYYLSTSTPGRLTPIPPSSGQFVPVIEALSNTLAKVVIRPPVSLN